MAFTAGGSGLLVLSNEDAERLLSMGECMDALATAYRDAAEGTALNGRRSDMLTRTAREDAVYCLKLVGGVVPSLKVGSLRLNSDILTFPETDGRRRKVKVPAAPGNRWVGLVLLFSTETGEPLAIFPTAWSSASGSVARAGWPCATWRGRMRASPPSSVPAGRPGRRRWRLPPPVPSRKSAASAPIPKAAPVSRRR